MGAHAGGQQALVRVAKGGVGDEHPSLALVPVQPSLVRGTAPGLSSTEETPVTERAKLCAHTDAAPIGPATVMTSGDMQTEINLSCDFARAATGASRVEAAPIACIRRGRAHVAARSPMLAHGLRNAASVRIRLPRLFLRMGQCPPGSHKPGS